MVCTLLLLFTTTDIIKAIFHFFTVLTDIDINSYDDDTLGTPSVASYRMNQDVFCVQPASLRAAGSFRSSRSPTGAIRRPTPAQQDDQNQSQLIKFRGKSYAIHSFIFRCKALYFIPNVSGLFCAIKRCYLLSFTSIAFNTYKSY